MPRSARTSLLTLLLALAIAPRAHADDRARAEALYDAGRRSFDLGEYADAIASWKASYKLSSAPQLLFNVGQAYRLAGDCARANRFYLNYQRAEPHPSNAAELATAMGKCAGVEPAEGEAAPSPVTAPAPVALPPPPPAPRGPRFRLASAISVGVGGAAAVTAAIYGFRAHDNASTIASQPAGTPWSPALDDAQRAGHAAATRARLFGVIGAAAIVTGGTLWWLGHRHARVQVDVAITPGHGEASVSCAF
ncbi:MAG: hypothetical protein K8W52_46050 [Deltaproteobacteria bacterium]|nr:hypothetical protein [Deltaproteobacteria bacterium]